MEKPFNFNDIPIDSRLFQIFLIVHDNIMGWLVYQYLVITFEILQEILKN